MTALTWPVLLADATMRASSDVHRAASFLCSNVSSVGGLAAANPGDGSGAWTTAECLFALLSAIPIGSLDHTCVTRLAEYLVETQLDDGGWPLIDGTQPCTMATGHAIAALGSMPSTMATPTTAEITDALKRGSEWLVREQHPLGSWNFGLKEEPWSGGLLVATYWACLGLYHLPMQSPSTMEAMARAKTCVTRAQLVDGSWGRDLPRTPDTRGTVSDTAQALQIMMGCFPPSRIVTLPSTLQFRRGLSWLERRSAKRRTTRAYKVAVRWQYAATNTVINNNSLCDSVIALSCAGHERALARPLARLVRGLSSDGAWIIKDEHGPGELSTWPTAEWLLAVAVGTAGRRGRAHRLFWAPFIAGVVLTSLVWAITLSFSQTTLTGLEKFWKEIPYGIRYTVLVVIGLGLIVTVGGSFIYEQLLRRFEKPH